MRRLKRKLILTVFIISLLGGLNEYLNNHKEKTKEIIKETVETIAEIVVSKENSIPKNNSFEIKNNNITTFSSFDFKEIPEYSGEGWYIVNDNIPFFSKDEIATIPFETYNGFDELGRTLYAEACFGPETLVSGNRADISSIHPSGWNQHKYEFISNGYLMSRSHLLMHAAGGDDIAENLISGTNEFNEVYMLTYETKMLDYIKETGNHVMYRVSPYYIDDNLMASGVLMEAYSVEDNGVLSFCVYCYNIQPNVYIDYSTGENWELE